MALGPQSRQKPRPTASVFVYLSLSGHGFNIVWQAMIKTYDKKYYIYVGSKMDFSVDILGNRRMWFSRNNGITIKTEVFHCTIFCKVYVSATWCIVLNRYASFRTQWHFWADVSKKYFKYHARLLVCRGYTVSECTEVALNPLKFHTKYLTYTLKNVYFIQK